MDDQGRRVRGVRVEWNHRGATVGDDELGGDPVADPHLLIAAHHRHELGLRGLLEHVPLQHDPIADPAGRGDVLGLVLGRRHRRRLVGDEHADLLDGTELQLVEPLADRAGSDDDLDEVVDVPRSIGAVRLRQPRGHELGLLQLVASVVDQGPQRDTRWRGHPAARDGGRLRYQSLPLQRHERCPDLRARELAAMGQVVDARPAQTDQSCGRASPLRDSVPTLRALPPPLLSPALSLRPAGWRTCAMAGIRRTSHSSRQTGASGTLARDAGVHSRVSLTQRDPNSGLAHHLPEDQHAPHLA